MRPCALTRACVDCRCVSVCFIPVLCSLLLFSIQQEWSASMHAWNVVQIGVQAQAVVDLWVDPGALYVLGTQKADLYIKGGTPPDVTIMQETLATVHPGMGMEGGEEEGDGSEGTVHFALPQSSSPIVMHSKLGGGAMGNVFRASVAGLTFALKRITNIKHTERALQEVVILEKLNHPNIVRYVGHRVVSQSELHIFMVWGEVEGL